MSDKDETGTRASDLLTESEAAAMLRVRAVTLKRWRRERKGPRFVRLGPTRVRYRRTDIDSWLDGRSIDPAVAALRA